MGMQMNQMRPFGQPRSAVHEQLIGKLLAYGDQAAVLGEHEVWSNVEYLKVAILDALDEARAIDAGRKRGVPMGPLYGIPVLLKDNIDTQDMPTTAGSVALEGSIPPRDAFITTKLRAAGAIILGKTNLSEWANFRGKRSISGWSSRGGLTRNPYALDRSACGSSSGSAAAVR